MQCSDTAYLSVPSTLMSAITKEHCGVFPRAGCRARVLADCKQHQLIVSIILLALAVIFTTVQEAVRTVSAQTPHCMRELALYSISVQEAGKRSNDQLLQQSALCCFVGLALKFLGKSMNE